MKKLTTIILLSLSIVFLYIGIGYMQGGYDDVHIEGSDAGCEIPEPVEVAKVEVEEGCTDPFFQDMAKKSPTHDSAPITTLTVPKEQIPESQEPPAQQPRSLMPETIPEVGEKPKEVVPAPTPDPVVIPTVIEEKRTPKQEIKKEVKAEPVKKTKIVEQPKPTPTQEQPKALESETSIPLTRGNGELANQGGLHEASSTGTQEKDLLETHNEDINEIKSILAQILRPPVHRPLARISPSQIETYSPDLMAIMDARSDIGSSPREHTSAPYSIPDPQQKLHDAALIAKNHPRQMAAVAILILLLFLAVVV